MKVGEAHITELVFEKTRGLLLKYGVKGWNMNDLASECNMSKRTLYKIIGSKEELLSETVIENLRKEVTRLKNYLESDRSFPELLINLTQEIIEGFDDFILSSLKPIRVEYPKIVEREEKFLQEQGEFFTLFFQKGKDQGCIVEHIEAKSLVTMTRSLIDFQLNSCTNKTEFKIEMKKILDAFFKLIMK